MTECVCVCVCMHVHTCRLTSGSNSASSGTSGMTSSISLLDDSLLCVPSPGDPLKMWVNGVIMHACTVLSTTVIAACSGSESSDDEDPESTSTVGFSRLR